MMGDNWFMEIAEQRPKLPARPSLCHLSFLSAEMELGEERGERGGEGRAWELGRWGWGF